MVREKRIKLVYWRFDCSIKMETSLANKEAILPLMLKPSLFVKVGNSIEDI